MKKENNKRNIGLAIVGMLILTGAFYGGMVYGKNKAVADASTARTTFGGGNKGGRGGATGFGGFTTGSIISKDDKSITVQIMGGGSKIIFLDSNTKVSKQTTGGVGDLVNGTQVSVMGEANADGSINATTVQIRPQTMVK